MNEEKVEYKQINVLVPKKDLEELDKQVRESKFNSRSEYVRYLIQNSLEVFEQKEEYKEGVKTVEEMLEVHRKLKPLLIELVKRTDMDNERKEETLKVLKEVYGRKEEERG